MTTRTTLKHGTANWWVLQALKDFGAMDERELLALGTHETPDALQAVRNLHMVTKNHDGKFEIQAKGRNALAAANKQRWKDHKTTRATSRTLVNAGVRGEPYSCPELKPYVGRPGAMDAYNLPSRVGDRRFHYRTGEVMA
jgi:hypothetical protein